MSTPKMQSPRHRSLLETIRNLTARRADIDSQITLFVRAGVKEGITWREMGEALGVSGQAAWERYRPDPPPKTGPKI